MESISNDSNSSQMSQLDNELSKIQLDNYQQNITKKENPLGIYSI